MTGPSDRGLRGRIRQGESLRGVLLRMPSEPLVELAGLSRLDFVVIDCEHGPGDEIALYRHLLAAGVNDLPVLVRVASLNQIGRVLDLGADGIVVPHVVSAAAADDAVRATRYPPEGGRGMAAYTRLGHYGRSSAVDLRDRAGSVVVVAMIEDPSGVEAARDICAVDGIDAILVGPADLAATSPVGTDVRSVVRHVLAYTAPAPNVVIVTSTSEALEWEAAGARLILVNLQHVLTRTFDELGRRRPG